MPVEELEENTNISDMPPAQTERKNIYNDETTQDKQTSYNNYEPEKKIIDPTIPMQRSAADMVVGRKK
jgi:hypothetical protein